MTTTDTGPQTATGRWLDEIAPQLWRQPSNRSMPMDPMQLEIRKAVRAIEAEARRLTVERLTDAILQWWAKNAGDSVTVEDYDEDDRAAAREEAEFYFAALAQEETRA